MKQDIEKIAYIKIHAAQIADRIINLYKELDKLLEDSNDVDRVLYGQSDAVREIIEQRRKNERQK